MSNQQRIPKSINNKINSAQQPRQPSTSASSKQPAATGASNISSGNSVQGKGSTQGKGAVGSNSTPQNPHCHNQYSRLQSSQNQHRGGGAPKREKNHGGDKTDQSGKLMKGNQSNNAAQPKEFHLRKHHQTSVKISESNGQHNSTTNNRSSGADHKEHQHQLNSSANFQQPQQTSATLEKINKSGNTVYINGLSGISSAATGATSGHQQTAATAGNGMLLKKGSIDLNCPGPSQNSSATVVLVEHAGANTAQAGPLPQKNGGQLFKNVAIVSAAENAVKQQHAPAANGSFEESGHKFGVGKHYSQVISGSGSSGAHISRAQKLNIQNNGTNNNKLGHSFQNGLTPANNEEQQLLLSFQQQHLVNQNGGIIFPSANGSALLSKTADKRQSYGQRQQHANQQNNQLLSIPGMQQQATPSQLACQPLNGNSSQLAQQIIQNGSTSSTGVATVTPNLVMMQTANQPYQYTNSNNTYAPPSSSQNNRQRPKSSVPMQKNNNGPQGANGQQQQLGNGVSQQQAILIQQQMQMKQQMLLNIPPNLNNTQGAVAAQRMANQSNQIQGNMQQPGMLQKKHDYVQDAHNSHSKKTGAVLVANQMGQHNPNGVLMNTQPLKHNGAGAGAAGTSVNIVSQTPQMLINKQHNMIMAQTNGAGNYAAQMHVLNQNGATGGVQIQQMQNQSQTAFFEKRNRSRGVPQQQIITNQAPGLANSSIATPNNTNATLLGTASANSANGSQQITQPNSSIGTQNLVAGMMMPQQMNLQSCNTFNSPIVMPDSSSSKKNTIGGSTGLVKQGQSEFIPPNSFEILQSSSINTSQSQNNQRGLIKDFNPQYMLRQKQIQQNAFEQQVAANSQLQVNLSMNSQPLPLSGQRSIDGSGAPNSAILPKVIPTQLNNSEVKQRQGIELNTPDTTHLLPLQSFDKRPPLITANGQVNQSQDFRNKENMTHKQVSRKGNQLLPGSHLSTSGNAGHHHQAANSDNTGFSKSQKARILQLSNQGYEYSQTVAKNSQRSEIVSKNGASNTHQNSVTQLREQAQVKLQDQTRDIQSQKPMLSKPSQLQQENIEMQLYPQTEVYFKRTYRHYFRRRPNKLDNPVIVINFQGILGDFFKDGGISSKQDHIMSKQYLQQQANMVARDTNNQNDQPSSHMWIRIGTIDGLRYLSKHFQIVIFSRDSEYEELNQPYSQIQMIQSYLQHNDILVDGIYGQSKLEQQMESTMGPNGPGSLIDQQNTSQTTAKGKKDKSKNDSKNGGQLKRPYKQGEIWEDYRQIYLDFGLTSDRKIRDKVLFVNSFDSDYNARQEDVRFDSKGYFLLDTQSKPARPLVSGIPLTYEVKEKEIDLSDKGQIFQFKLAKNKIQTKEMPVTILVPNPRTVYCQQLSFASIAKTIMTMCFVGQNLNLQMSKKLSPQEIDYLQFYLKNLRYLQEFDVKVQKDQCLLQYNPSQQRLTANLYSQYSTQQQVSHAKGTGGADDSIEADQQNHKTQMYRSTNSQNDRENYKQIDDKNPGTATKNNFQISKEGGSQHVINQTNLNGKKKDTNQQSKLGNRNNSNKSIDSMYNRPRSSNSHGRILQAQGPQMQPLNQEEEQQMNIDIEFFQNNETMVIPLTEQLFQNISWAQSFDFINDSGASRDILGLVPIRSNIIWRYFLSLLKQRSNIRQLREKRIAEIKTLLQILDNLQTEQGKMKRQQQIQEIYDTLKQVQTSGNPLTNMMARNLKVFIKIYAEVKRKSKRELDNFTEALVMDQKMAELEKQNLENRIFLLGAKKPNQFFNTHPRAYEKVPQNVTNSMNISMQNQVNQQSKLYENQGNNMVLMNGGNSGIQTHNLLKQKTNNLQNSNNFAYSSISSTDNANSDPTHRSLMEIAQNSSSHKNSKGGPGNTKYANNASSGTQSASHHNYGKKKQSTGLQSACNNNQQQQMSSLNTAGNSGGMHKFSTQSSAAHYSRRRVASRGTGEPNSATEGNNSKRSNQSSEFQQFSQHQQQVPPSGPAAIMLATTNSNNQN